MRRRLKSLLCGGFVAVTALLVLLPIALVMVHALMSEQEILSLFGSEGYARLRLIPHRLTLQQYYRVLIEQPEYLHTFWNSMGMTLPIVAGQTLVGTLAAYALGCYRFKGRTAVFFLYVAVMLMPSQATIVPNYIMVRRLGLLGGHASVILPGIFGTFGVVLLRQFMAAVPREYLEAAKLDGAGPLRTLFRVVLPLVWGGVASVVILCFVDSWGMVETPLVFLEEEKLYPLSVFLSGAKMSGTLFAASALAMTPPLLLFLAGRDELVRGIELSGLK